MAYIKTLYCCPVCHRLYPSNKEAVNCRNQHPVMEERWAIGADSKAVKIYDNCAPNSYGSAEWALREADLSDYIEVRKRQLQERSGIDGTV